MKKDGKYRYSLQFGMSSEEEIRAGELLESLGNKKSKVLIAALNEYVTNHPELESERCELRISYQLPDLGLQKFHRDRLVTNP